MLRNANSNFSNNGLKVITVESSNGQPSSNTGKSKKKTKDSRVDLLVRPFNIIVCLTPEARRQLIKMIDGSILSRDYDPALRRLPKAVLGFDVTVSGRPCRVVVVPVGGRGARDTDHPTDLTPVSGDVVIAVADHVTTQLDGRGLANLLADHVRAIPTTPLRFSVTLGRQVGVAPNGAVTSSSASKCAAPSRSNLPVHERLMRSMVVTPSLTTTHPSEGTRPRASSLRLPPSTAAALLAKSKASSRDVLGADWRTRPLRPDDRCERRLVDSASATLKQQPIAAIKSRIGATLRRHLTLPNFRDILTTSRKSCKPLPALAEVDESRDIVSRDSVMKRCSDEDTQIDAMRVSGNPTRSTPFMKWSLRRKSKTFICPTPQQQPKIPPLDHLNPYSALISNNLLKSESTSTINYPEQGAKSKENLTLEIKVVGALAYISGPTSNHVTLLDQIQRALRIESANQTAELRQGLTCLLEINKFGFTLYNNNQPYDGHSGGYSIPLKDVLIFNYNLTSNDYDHYFGLLCKRVGHDVNVVDLNNSAVKRDYWLMRTESKRAIHDLKERIHQFCQRCTLPLQILEGLQWIANDAEFVRNQIDCEQQSLKIRDELFVRPNNIIKMKLEEQPTYARDSSGTCDSGILMMDVNNMVTNDTFQQLSEDENLAKNYSSPSYGSLESQNGKGGEKKGEVITVKDGLNCSLHLIITKELFIKRSLSCPSFSSQRAEGQTFFKKAKSVEPLVLSLKEITLHSQAYPNRSSKNLTLREKQTLTPLLENIWVKRNSVNTYGNVSSEIDLDNLIPKLETVFPKEFVSSDVKFNSWGSTGRNRRLSYFMETLKGNLKPCKSDMVYDRSINHIVKCDITKKVNKKNSLAIGLLNRTRVNSEIIRNSFRFSSVKERDVRRRFTSIPLPKADEIGQTSVNLLKPNFSRFVPNLRCSFRSFAGSNGGALLNPTSTWVSQGGNLNAQPQINPNTSNLGPGGPGLSMSLKSNSNSVPGPPSATGAGGSLGTLNDSFAVGGDVKNRTGITTTATCREDWFSEYVRAGVNDRIARWAVSFDNLLSDPFGLQVFTDFLVKEYSQENIEFWKDCQEYSKIPPEETVLLSSKAHTIYRKYLSDDAPNPVNVNANCRCSIKQKIGDESEESHDLSQLFDGAQTQIYTLMRYDSYARFIKSDIYKDLVTREIEQKSHTFSDANHLRDSKLPILKSHALAHTSHDPLDDSMKKWKTNLFFSKSKLDNLLATALNRGMGLSEESRILTKYSDDLKRRRKGLPELVPIQVCKDKETTILVDKDQLPTATHQTLAQDATGVKDRPESLPAITNTNLTLPEPHAPPAIDASVGDGADNYLLSRYTFAEQSGHEPKAGACTFHIRQSTPPKNGSELIVTIEPKTWPAQGPVDDITVKRAILHVCKLKGLEYSAVDVFTDDKEPIDLNRSLSDFMGSNVYVEQRVLFQIILLPSGKSLGVKTRPNKDLVKVLAPILEMYGIKDTSDIEIYRESDGEKILMTDDVMKIDKSTIIVCPKKGGAHLRSSYENFKSNEFPFKEPKKPPASTLGSVPGKRRPLKRSITIDIDGPPSTSAPSPHQPTAKSSVPKASTDLGTSQEGQNTTKSDLTKDIMSLPEFRLPRMSTEYFGDLLDQPVPTINPTPNSSISKPVNTPAKNPLLEYDPALPPYYVGNANNNNSNGRSGLTWRDLKEISAEPSLETRPRPKNSLRNAVLLQTASSNSLNMRSSCSFLSGRRLSKLFVTNSFK